MSIIVGIDVGGSTTKIVGFNEGRLMHPLMVKADDPIASVYGGFGKFTSEHGVLLSDISRVMVTGVGSTFLGSEIYGLPAEHINEFRANGRGGLYLSGISKAVIVSMGTGTAFVYADGEKGEYLHLGGTGVGGGTLVGLGRQLLGVSSAKNISELALKGDLSKIDLLISDITDTDISPTLSKNATASNFGNISDLASKEDIALGIINMVFETVGMMAVFAARMRGIKDIVVIGSLPVIPQAREILGTLADMFGVNIILPESAPYGTVIGAALERVDGVNG
ncbi:MAG: type II pantothenate kinase [Clostridia bacterium]|nr:type II pantothenate kinase [Clostridia bacterium]